VDKWSEYFVARSSRHIPLGEETLRLLASPHLTREVPDASNNSFINMEGEQHGIFRRLLFSYLSKGVSLNELQQTIERCYNDFDPPGDLVKNFVHPVVAHTIFEIFEIPAHIRDEAATYLHGALGCLNPDDTVARQAITKLARLMAQTLRHPVESGLLADLQEHVHQKAITQKQAIAGSVAILHGGHENPLLLISSYLADLLDGTTTTKSEIVNKYAPVDAVTRIAQQDQTIGGATVAEGEIVLIHLGDDQWKEIPFGWGRHACPGQKTTQQIVEAFVNFDVASRPLRKASSADRTHIHHRVKQLMVDRTT